MGLRIHSLGELPVEASRAYYVYMLDYGWYEPLGKALKENFAKMAELASKHNAVVMQGTSGCEFNDEVLSWHRINGQEAEDILPAILITNIHPSQFRDGAFHVEPHRQIVTENLILIPIRDICETSTDVAILINQIFTDIQQKKSLPQFEVARQLKKGQRGALVDALILEPNFSGIGIDLRKLFGFFSRH